MESQCAWWAQEVASNMLFCLIAKPETGWTEVEDLGMLGGGSSHLC